MLENISWIFSGIGVKVGSYLLKKKDNSNIEDQQKLEKYNKNLHKEKLKKELTEVQKLSKRFQLVLNLMNENRASCLKFTIAKLAEIMNLQRISELEDILIGRQEPDFQFIEKFSKTFGVNKRWLVEGIGTPFSNDFQTKLYPTDYFEMIEEIKPDRIYFVKENSRTSPAFILLRVSKWKYLILHRTWHISDEVGATGQAQLYSFYCLIKKLYNQKDLYINCNGLILEKEEFNLLLGGEVFPGKFVDIGFTENPWWDDLVDIYHNYPISTSYENWYGKSFIKAQQIVKSYIEHRL